MPWYLGNSRGFWDWGNWMVLLMIWSVIWKGLALWHSARRGEKVWFGVLLVINTAGILEILYLLLRAKIFSSKKHK